jgi:hypothetical protein
MGEATFSHHLDMPEIDLVGDGRARAVWSVIVHSQRSDCAGKWVDETRSEYHEDYRQGPGRPVAHRQHFLGTETPDTDSCDLS